MHAQLSPPPADQAGNSARKLLSRVALLIPAALLVALLAQPLGAKAPPPLQTSGPQRYGMNDAGRRAAFLAIAAHEQRWRRYARRKFPTAPWSAEDDYHWHVQAHITRTLAPRLHLANSQLWALYDEAVHDRWSITQPAAKKRATKVSADAQPAFRAYVVPLRPRQR